MSQRWANYLVIPSGTAFDLILYDWSCEAAITHYLLFYLFVHFETITMLTERATNRQNRYQIQSQYGRNLRDAKSAKRDVSRLFH